jgi:uncharacterized membrane protein
MRHRMESKAQILGHPIHPMTVGFPVAFYTATLASYLAYAASGDPFWFRVGVVANVAGVLMAAVAAIPGFIDWALAIPNEHPAKATGLTHMLLNVGALVLFGIDAVLQGKRWQEGVVEYGSAIALAAIGMALTLAAGFLGWKLVQKHHIGIDLTAEQKRIDAANVVPSSSRANPPNDHDLKHAR